MNNSPLFEEFEAAFEAEIQEVRSTLLAATTDLTSPLGDLVRAQIKRSQPPICAGVVLVVSKPQAAVQANGDLRRKRILLAAALEMLHVALNVHRLLINAARFEQRDGEQQGGNDVSLDRSFIGSTILAGDYCFSRAAQMAAQTDHPLVVSTFSLALQTVSEGLLREQFHPNESNGNYDETRQLLESGAYAAALLVDLPESEQQEAIALSHELASQWKLYAQEAAANEGQPFDSRSEPLPASWQVLHQWHNRRHTTTEAPPSPQRQY